MFWWTFLADGLQESATVQGFASLISYDCCEPLRQACLLLSADILSLGTGLSSGCTSAIWQYYPDHPLHVCQGIYSPWKLPAFKPASSLACLNAPSTTELQAVAFCWQNHPSDAREGVRSTYRSTRQVSGMHHAAKICSTSSALGERSVRPPAVFTASSACAANSHLAPALATEHLERGCHTNPTYTSSVPGGLMQPGRWEFAWTFASKELLIISYLTAL